MKNILVHLFYTVLVKPMLTFFIGVRFENTAALSKVKQFIIIGNHNSHLDAVSIRAVLAAHQKKETYTVAAKDYFGTCTTAKVTMKWFLNAILIHRQRAAHKPSAIEILDNHIIQGKSLILFPEGSRGAPGVMTDFKKGIAVLLKRHPDLHIIPTYFNGFGRVLPKNCTICLPLNSKVRFGDPIQVQATQLEDILLEVRQTILDLKRTEEPDRNRFQLDF